MDHNSVVVKGLVYFGKPHGYVTRSIMLSVGPTLVNRSERRDQTKSDPKGPHETYKKRLMYSVWIRITGPRSQACRGTLG